jgi:hypothetical protein
MCCFKIFHRSVAFNECKQEQSLRGKGETLPGFLPTAAEQFCLISYNLTASFPGNFITPSQ